MLIDKNTREEALNTSKSYIVTAPAGSGKTYLLTRRILNLLLTVDDPLHVIAITFTKKASIEMKERVKLCLEEATELVAKKVLERSDEKERDILNNIENLSIMTIDAFSSWLLSKGKPSKQALISQNPRHIYQSIIFQYFNKKEFTQAQAALLRTCGQYQHLESLLTSLLATRDQWLDPIDQKDLAKSCKLGIIHIRSQAIDTLNAKLANIEKDISTLFELSEAISTSMEVDPVYTSKTLGERFSNLATICLTTTGDVRKSFNKRQGIYPKAKINQATLELQDAFKQTAAEIQDYLTEHVLCQDLLDIKKLPSDQTLEEINLLDDLSDVLHHLLQDLQLYFSNQDICDFISITQSSILALKTDAILQLFCKNNIHHLLIDEFQDTSKPQYQLLESILDLWPPLDSRTLFTVGDPMQSIYRFRQADVSLFLKLQSEPIAHISLTPLHLLTNFRSSSRLIAIVNDLFTDLFPSEAIPFYAGIPYHKATSIKAGNNDDTLHLHIENTEDGQAMCTLNVLQSLMAKYPNDHIAILVQARSHLNGIIPLLEQYKIPFNAIDIYPALSLSSIQDLSALLSAIIDPYDRLSLMIVLRSPLCGIQLELLDTLSHDHNINTLNAKIDDPYFIKFQQSWRACINEPNPVIKVFRIYTSLLGPHLYPQNQRLAIQTWFTEVNKRYEQNLTLDRLSLLNHFSSTYNSISTPNAKVSLLTAHKSKGLEFDHVIIPHTEKRKPSASLPLFYCEHSQHPIIQPSFSSHQHNIDYFKYINKRRDQYENLRLLYVACTRAKSTLHLIGYPNSTSSWLDKLHPLIQSHTNTVIHQSENESELMEDSNPACLRTLDHQITQIKPNKHKDSNDAKIGQALHYYMQCYCHPNKTRKWQYYLSKQNLNMLDLQNHVNNIEQHQNENLFQWITKTYPFERSEFHLQYEGKQYIVDRIFLDQSILWIIDYKFPISNLSDEYLITQYGDQLRTYQLALHQFKPHHTIKLGLYLPLTNHFIEVKNQDLSSEVVEDLLESHPL